MAAGSGDLQRAPRGDLAFDVTQIGRMARRGRWRLVRDALPACAVAVGWGRWWPVGCIAGACLGRLCLARLGQKLLHHVQQMARAVDARLRHQRGFVRAVHGQHQSAHSLVVVRLASLALGQRHHQGAADGTQLARQRQLASKLEGGQPAGVELSAGCQNAQRQRQVEAPRVLGQIGRRQVDRHAFVARKVKAAALQRGAHAFACLLDLGIGQADQREAGQPVGQMNLHRHRRGLQPVQCPAPDHSHLHGASLSFLFWNGAS